MKIIQIKKHSFLIDTGEIIPINKNIKFDYNLYEDKEIDGEDIDNILYDVALSYSYNLLSRRDYASKEILNKCYQKIGRKDITKKVLDRLKESNYIDDIEYARTYISSKKYGRKRVFYELSLKGIQEQDINIAYNDIEIDEEELIKKLIPKLKNKEKNKQISYLIRRGFEMDDILKLI